MTYLVKDTFQYTGDLVFNTLEEFVNFFWRGEPNEVFENATSYLSVDQHLKLSILYTGIVTHSWDSETKIYTRVVDFESAINYMECRINIDNIRDSIINGSLVVDNNFRDAMTLTMNLQKTTEFIG